MSFITFGWDHDRNFDDCLLYRRDQYRSGAIDSVRTPFSAHTFDEEGNIVMSCHISRPPRELYGPFEDAEVYER